MEPEVAWQAGHGPVRAIIVYPKIANRRLNSLPTGGVLNYTFVWGLAGRWSLGDLLYDHFLENELMIRKIAKMTACFAAGLFALTLGVGAITANEKAKDLSVEEVMKKGHSKTGVIAKLKTAVKGEKWDDAAAAGKDLKELGEALAANKAPKGDAASWTKLATKYKDNTAAAAAAAEKKDAAGVTKALGGINCKEGHDAHK